MPLDPAVARRLSCRGGLALLCGWRSASSTGSISHSRTTSANTGARAEPRRRRRLRLRPMTRDRNGAAVRPRSGYPLFLAAIGAGARGRKSRGSRSRRHSSAPSASGSLPTLAARPRAARRDRGRGDRRHLSAARLHSRLRAERDAVHRRRAGGRADARRRARSGQRAGDRQSPLRPVVGCRRRARRYRSPHPPGDALLPAARGALAVASRASLAPSPGRTGALGVAPWTVRNVRVYGRSS